MTHASPCKLPAALPQLWPVIPPAEQSTAPSSCYSSLSFLSPPNGFATMQNCLPTPWTSTGKGFCFCSSGIEIHFGSAVAVLWAGSELSHGLITCIALMSGVEERSAKGEKAHRSFLMTFYTINQDYVSLVIRARKIRAGSP